MKPLGFALLALLLGVAGCSDETAGPDGADAAPLADADSAGGIAHEGPPSACGGFTEGSPLHHASASVGDDLLKLLGFAGGAAVVAFDVKDGGAALLTLNARDHFQLAADGRTLVFSAAAGSSAAGAAGEVFADINHGWGGLVRLGAVCLEAPPQAGVALAGAWALVVEVLADDTHPARYYRLTGQLAADAGLVTAGGVDALTGATVTLD